MSTEKFFQPMDELILIPSQWRLFTAHYGSNASRQEIIEKVYGGYPILNLYNGIEFVATDEKERRANITLIPSSSYISPLKLLDVSLKQFLVSGNPLDEWLPWDGNDNWEKLDPQYRLELCHSEISRWSIIFKKDGVIRGGAKIEGHEPFSYIELVNNCTTTDGFEFKLIHEGQLYHGSFGRDGNIADFYEKLSRWQAGSLAKQNKPLQPNGSNFFQAYFNPLDPSKNIDIDLERYRKVSDSSTNKKLTVKPNFSEVNYYRWGKNVEYEQKPLKRKLIHSIIYEWKDDQGNIVQMPIKEAPILYRDIEEASSIVFPDFKTTGIYDLSAPQKKSNYSSLYKIDTCILRILDDKRVELDLRSSTVDKAYGFRRLVVGNIDLDSIPVFPAFYTMHRLGFGARNTVMYYDPGFVPSSDLEIKPHYAYLLGGDGENNDAKTYIPPEGFGIERVILSWKNYDRTVLTIDLISFERILPIWQGDIAFDT